MNDDTKKKVNEVLADFYDSINHLTNKVLYFKIEMAKIKNKENEIFKTSNSLKKPKKYIEQNDINSFLDLLLKQSNQDVQRQLIRRVKEYVNTHSC